MKSSQVKNAFKSIPIFKILAVLLSKHDMRKVNIGSRTNRPNPHEPRDTTDATHAELC